MTRPQDTLDFSCVCSNDESPDFNDFKDTIPFVSNYLLWSHKPGRYANSACVCVCSLSASSYSRTASRVTPTTPPARETAPPPTTTNAVPKPP